MPITTDPDMLQTMPDASQTSVRSVALVTPSWPMSHKPNGIVSYTANLREGLQRLDVRSTVHSLETSADCGDDFVRRFSIDSPTFRDKLQLKFSGTIAHETGIARRFAQSLLRSVEQAGDVELIEMEESFGWFGQVARDAHVPVVVRLHGPWFLNGLINGVPEDDAFARRDAAEREGLSLAAGVSSVSYDVLRRVRERYKLELPHARVIPNPVPPVAEEDRWSLETCDRNTVLFVGRFDRHKGGDLILDAFARILQQKPDARLILVAPGRGVIDESNTIWSVENYLNRTFPNPRSREQIEVRGFTKPEEIRKLRRSALLTVVPSRYETFSMTAVEAMSAGCPLVAARVGGLAEIVTHELNGLTFEGGSAASLATQIARLLADPALAEQLGRQARRDCESKYHPDVVAKMTIDYYADMIKKRSE